VGKRLSTTQETLPVSYPNKRKWTPRAVGAVVLRYGLAFASVGTAMGLARLFLHFHLPQPFAAFALSAIAITFWYGGSKPGIVAAVLASIIRYTHWSEADGAVSRALYDLVFVIFALLMMGVNRARGELEVSVAQRTADLTRANQELNLEIGERKRAEDKLRQSEAYLAEAQKLTHTGSWVWEVGGKRALHLSGEWYRVYSFDPSDGLAAWQKRLQRIHPDDRARRQQIIDKAITERSEYEVEYRILLPDGAVRHIYSVGHPVSDDSGKLVQFVGSSTDITDRRQAEEALRQAQTDLARISRVTTMGELTASLAHEVNQPIAAAVTDANTCLRWLNREQPDLEEARQAASRVVKDATRAAEVISRTRLIFKKGSLQSELIDMNEVIREMVGLMGSELTRQSISVRMELAEELPRITGDRVQLQQVLMNLVINGIDAMKDANGTRELAINSQPAENGQILVSISDSGVGLPVGQADEIFNAFFTTKPNGTGMGLRISRSIIESHGGRLWASDNSPRGARFHLTLPVQGDAHE
jgi:C4-dicarboxylate-specific signal transduction histidine kinase